MSTETFPTETSIYESTPGLVSPDWQLGSVQARTWRTMTNAQRTEANRLMAGGLAASKALKQATA